MITVAKTQPAFIPEFRIPLLDTVKNRCCLLEFCSKSSLHSHNGGGSCVFQNTKWLLKFTERHICYYSFLAANQGKYVRGLLLKKTWRVSISVRITMIRCVIYLLRIFKVFHGLMNNPVLLHYCILSSCLYVVSNTLCSFVGEHVMSFLLHELHFVGLCVVASCRSLANNFTVHICNRLNRVFCCNSHTV